MERIARLVKNSELSRQVLSDEDLAQAVWPAAVGKAIASHTSRVRLVRSTLVVEVEDALWQQQLYRLSAQILHRLRTITGDDGITELEFRIGIPKIQPRREEGRVPALEHGKARFGN